MSKKFFDYNGETYPDLIRNGFHSQYIIPIAQKFCTGKGIDIGCASETWAFPGTDKCDLTMKEPWNDAMKIPVDKDHYDFVFSSHCLEHIPDYYAALEEWTRVLKPDGILFLYLPSIKCEYWRPANDRNHLHILYPEDLEYDLKDLGYCNILISGVDMAYSYTIVAEKGIL